jgi:CBS domain containing-hemolysin-like protein
LVNRAFGNFWLGVFSGAFTFAILFFAEIVPKSLGVRFAGVLAPNLAIPLQMMVWALWPVVQFSVLITRIWGKGARISHGTEEDIISLARLIEKQGEIFPHEAEWVTNALRLNNVVAYDLMTPGPVVARLSEDLALKETRFNSEQWRFSRLPVHRAEYSDEIVGVVRRRKIFNALAQDQFELRIADLMDPPVFVSEQTPAHQLLDEFLKSRRHLFCVKDEHGHFTGVVTLEDVLECLLGREIVDETDLHEDMQEVARRRTISLLASSRKRMRESESEDSRP